MRIEVEDLMSRWPGTMQEQAWEAYRLCIESGMTSTRASSVAAVCSFRDGWIFRAAVAECVGCCVRTVQRAISQAASLGIIGRARAKPKEIPPGLHRPLPCGWSHRWMVGAGMDAVHAVAARSAARMAYLARSTARLVRSVPEIVERSARMTVADLDAALARLPRRWRPPDQ